MKYLKRRSESVGNVWIVEEFYVNCLSNVGPTCVADL
jgi:hypothetical protein